jgi:TPR repeat protein
MVQGYLESRGICITSPELDDALQPVAVQLEGLREDRLRLAVRAFAKYVREKVYSDRDVVRMLERVGQWLACDAESPVGAAGAFLRNWGAPKRDEKFRAVAEKMIDLLRGAERHRELLIASHLYWRPGKKLVPIAEKALREAAGAAYPSAMRALGSRLLDGRGLAVDATEGERLLRRAADADDPDAMSELGSRLLDGDRLAMNTREGEDWLRKAADSGDADAMSELGSRLLDGRGLAVNAAEGERWLQRAIGAGDPVAMSELGTRLLDGRGLPLDPGKGERWLRKAAETGYPPAMIEFGSRRLDGRGLVRRRQEIT